MASSAAGSALALEGAGRGSLLRALPDVDVGPRSEREAFGGERVLVDVLVPFRIGERDRDRRRGISRSLSIGTPASKSVGQIYRYVLAMPQTDLWKICICQNSGFFPAPS